MAAYSRATPPLDVFQVSVVLFLLGSTNAVILAALIQTQRFLIEVSDESVLIRGVFRTREIQYQDIWKITAKWPVNGRGGIELMGKEGNRLCLIDGGIQDFSQLLFLIESHCFSHTIIRERGIDRRWVERGVNR